MIHYIRNGIMIGLLFGIIGAVGKLMLDSSIFSPGSFIASVILAALTGISLSFLIGLYAIMTRNRK
jgi:hypothetical protein